MLKAEVVQQINQQITSEMYAANLYLQMSAWCEKQGLSGAAAFFRKHVPEEISHRDKFVDYLIDCDADVVISQVPAPNAQYKSLVDVIHSAYEHEQKITKQVHALAELAMAHKDFNTFNMLQFFISEQREEENLFRSILDQVKLVAFQGETGAAMFHINNYLNDLATRQQ
jgi:ferritin